MSYLANIEDDAPGELTAAQARPDNVAGILIAIMDGFNLSDFERELVLQKLNDLNQTISTPRAGKTLGGVVDFLKREKGRSGSFTLQDVRSALSGNGIKATPKEIYNALGYLTRKGHIQNTGYGQYQVSKDQKGDQ